MFCDMPWGLRKYNAAFFNFQISHPPLNSYGQVCSNCPKKAPHTTESTPPLLVHLTPPPQILTCVLGYHYKTPSQQMNIGTVYEK